MFKVEIKKKAFKELEKLDKKRKERIGGIISLLKGNPIPFREADVSKLKGYDNIYRIRVGNLRIIYEAFWNERKILIHFIGPREKAYKP